MALIYNRLLLDSLDPALAQVTRRSLEPLDYLFVVLLTAAIVVSLKVIGALLVEAMVVVPAAAARNLARTTRAYLASASRPRSSPASAASCSPAASWCRAAAPSCWP